MVEFMTAQLYPPGCEILYEEETGLESAIQECQTLINAQV